MLAIAKKRYFIELSYLGTAYHGWQRQPNAVTVQQVIEEAFAVVLGQPVVVHGQGRTDTGVHATRFFAHFEFEAPLHDALIIRLNGFLPSDISILQIFEVAPTAHARFSASARRYAYHVHTKKNPFAHERSMRLYQQPDYEKMNQAAQILLKYNDFACFARSGGGQQTTLCTITEAQWVVDGDRAVFYITANRFLRNMVRAVVGSLLEIGMGKKDLQWLHQLLQHGKRSDAGSSVAACGLYLIDISYPSSILPDATTA